MLDYLLLLSGNDIPFEQAKLVIHQPTIKEIAFIGEECFFSGCSFLNFSKENIDDKGKINLGQATDFEILMTVIKQIDNPSIQRKRQDLESILLLLFPQFKLNFLPTSIMLSKDDERFLIDKDNFQIFKSIINRIFCLKGTLDTQSKYNPGGPQARALVQKFRKRQKKLNELRNKGKNQKTQILSRYVSILSVGEAKDMNSFLNYTVFQLFDEFHRFKLRQDFDIYIKCKLAGAKDIQEVKNWMGDLNSDD